MTVIQLRTKSSLAMSKCYLFCIWESSLFFRTGRKLRVNERLYEINAQLDNPRQPRWTHYQVTALFSQTTSPTELWRKKKVQGGGENRPHGSCCMALLQPHPILDHPRKDCKDVFSFCSDIQQCTMNAQKSTLWSYWIIFLFWFKNIVFSVVFHCKFYDNNLGNIYNTLV